MVMGLSVKPQHLKRYKDIVALFMKYGRSDLVKGADLNGFDVDDRIDQPRANGTMEDEVSEGERLAADLERLGPTYIKLGQMLSTRADLLPADYLNALSRLQDRIEPFDFETLEQLVSNELGTSLKKVFSEFDQTPLAAASLGQVHRAALRDGRLVAVKVQRPNIRDQIIADLESMAEIAKFLDAHTEVGRRYEFTRIVAEFHKTILVELDYRKEARHLKQLGENLECFECIIVPKPIEDLTTSRVLTMEFVRGRKITELSPVALIELDRTGLAEELSHAYLKQILVDGLFHADPHPGNVHLTGDGRLVLLDLGMVGRISPNSQESLVKLLLAISEGRGDDAARVALDMGELKDDADPDEFSRRGAEFVVRHQTARLEEIRAGRVVLEFHAIAADCGIRLPQEFTLIGKTLLNLDAITRTLDPKFDPNASIRRNAADILQQRMRRKMSPGNVYNALLEASEFMQHLPERLNRFMHLAAENKLKVEVDAIDEDALICGLQKIANRITVGLILAALIIGAALIMRIQTRFEIMGYPGLAIMLFAFAAIGGIGLVINIWRSDR
jgi:ubiquinone biosynthesis protein